MSVSLIELSNDIRGRGKTAIFTVGLPASPEVFMCVRALSPDEHHGVVIVDAHPFLTLWRAAPTSIHRVQAWGTPDTWRREYKFGWAAEGFASGRRDPVPLAQISYGVTTQTTVSYKYRWFGRETQTRQIPYVSFTNGVTRTIWLLAHGCPAFPILCWMPEALALQRVAGVPGTHVFTLRDLYEDRVALG